MAVFLFMAFTDLVLAIFATSAITTEKLNKRNYLSWVDSMELWFLGLAMTIYKTQRPLEPLAPFGRKLESFTHDIPCLNDAAQTLVFLKQTNHDMVSFIAEALEKKLGRLYMALILGTLHSDFNNALGQLLTGHEVPLMDNLITKLRVPTK